jgi:hypothetical protein
MDFNPLLIETERETENEREREKDFTNVCLLSLSLLSPSLE